MAEENLSDKIKNINLEKVDQPESAGEKKPQKEKKAKQAPPPPAPPAPITPARVDFRVGHILKAIKHPDADSLYVSTIDLKEDEPRTVVSGLVKYIPLEEMQNRKVVCICNLKPAVMRGVKSYAMVLAASPKGGEKSVVELVIPPPDAEVGSKLWFEGYDEGEPDTQLPPKKKIFETIQPQITTTDALEVVYIEKPEGDDESSPKVRLLIGETGVCKVPTLKNANVS